MLSAHWDHLGKKTDGNETKVFAGAVDNASGVAAMLELGRYFSAKKNLDRSLLLCSFTAEEQGLFGAKYFVENPPMPLSQIKGMVNLDSLNIGEANKAILLYGRDEGKLSHVLRKVATSKARQVLPDPVGEKGYFFRSDHYPFVYGYWL